ncbi:MAG: DUF5103 domain-containing protein [Saprospiraceae bacterium]|nr:DUF5103 domain-containing protein [Saprospiraceae bacterium]
MRIHLLAFTFILFFNYSLQGQYEDIYFEDYVYVTNIKSVKINPSGTPLEPPVFYLGNSQRLVVSFDDMDNVQKDFTYGIIHCNKDWEPSGLEMVEYIDGFIDEEIDNSAFSVNTFVPYINYQLSLPNNDLSWTISGNYLLVIYEGGDVDDRIPVITRRFMVVDKKVNVSVKNRRPLDVTKLRTHYEFDLFVNNKDFKILDPRNNISVMVLQNYRWDIGIKNLKPRFFVGDQMTIDNTGLISFPAYKEFRSADIRSLDFVANGITSIDLNDYGTDVLLDLGRPRGDSYYTTIPDANGQFVIQNRDLGTDNTGGDYANVIFTLETPERDEEIYVMGSFTDWKPDEMYRMRYYDDQKVYVAEILLKQGYYDFYYGVDEDGVLNARAIEGSWADTENDYQVFVYLREPGDRYDRLIGYYTFNSNF